MAKRKTITPIYPYDPLEEYQGQKPAEAHKSSSSPDRLLIIIAGLLVVTILSTVVLFTIVLSYVSDLSASRNERALLLKTTDTSESDKSIMSISAFDMEMREINPDYLCWITIEGTAIDYPVVRGNDNEKYLHMSFYGEENQFGTLFMDYRCVGEYVPHIIIYGHNTKQGDMFGGLRKFLDEQYLAEHSIISLKVNDRIIEYEIFSARKANINDPAYYLDFSTPNSFRAFAERCGAPSESEQIITLSTCVSGDDKDERVIVQGILRVNN